MTSAARRFQRGSLTRTRAHWILRLRVDHGTGDRKVRREERIRVGLLADLPTRALARAAADRIADEMTGRRRVPGRIIRADAYARQYLKRVVPLLRTATQANVRSILKAHVMPLCEGRRLDEIGAEDVQQLVERLAARGRAPSTCRSIVRQVRAMLRTAGRAGFAVELFDACDIRFPRRERVGTAPRSFTLEEVRRLLAAAEQPWRALYGVCALLGLRAGEALGLTWSDVDFAAGVVSVRCAAVLGRLQLPKTAASAARLPLSAALATILTEYRWTWQDNAQGLLFASRRGRPLYATSVRRRLARDLRALGMPSRGLHAFRRFAASVTVNHGGSLSAARDLLRHTSSTMTNAYLLTVPEDVRHAADQLGALVANPVCGEMRETTSAKP